MSNILVWSCDTFVSCGVGQQDPNLNRVLEVSPCHLFYFLLTLLFVPQDFYDWLCCVSAI